MRLGGKAQRSSDHGWTGKPPTYQAQIFDGFSYLIRTSTKVVLLDTSLQDSQQSAFQETNDDEDDKQYYASNSFGRTLFARTAYVDEDAGQAVVAQFLDNDLAPADPGDAPSNCAVSGPIDEPPNAYAAIYVTTGNGGTGGSAASGAGGSVSAGTGGAGGESSTALGGTGGSTHAGGSVATDGSVGTDNAAGSDGEMPSAEGGTSADGGSGAPDATGSSGEASAVGGSGGASHAGNAAVPPRKSTEPTRGGCSYAPRSPSHSSWLWLVGLVAIAQRRRRADWVRWR